MITSDKINENNTETDCVDTNSNTNISNSNHKNIPNFFETQDNTIKLESSNSKTILTEESYVDVEIVTECSYKIQNAISHDFSNKEPIALLKTETRSPLIDESSINNEYNGKNTDQINELAINNMEIDGLQLDDNRACINSSYNSFCDDSVIIDLENSTDIHHLKYGDFLNNELFKNDDFLLIDESYSDNDFEYEISSDADMNEQFLLANNNKLHTEEYILAHHLGFEDKRSSKDRIKNFKCEITDKYVSEYNAKYGKKKKKVPTATLR